MTELTTNGTQEPPGLPLSPARCQKRNGKGEQCRREHNHVARCRFSKAVRPRGAADTAKPRAPVAPADFTPRHGRITLIVMGGEPEAREAVAHFVQWAMQAMTRDVDTTFADPPRGTVEAMTALEGYRISIRNAGG